MNQVSNLKLALAVAEAGAVPTISGFNYISQNLCLNIAKLVGDFDIYISCRNRCDFIFSIDDRFLVNNKIELLKCFVKYKIQYVELILDSCFLKDNINELNKIIIDLKNNNIKLLTKLISLKVSGTYINNNFDGIIFKGPHGAARVTDDTDVSIKNLLRKCIDKFPNKFIIASGGIGTAKEVNDLLNAGAGAIGIGTMFAASEESPLSNAAKEKLVNSSFQDLKKLKTYDYDQNALIFSEIKQSKINNTLGLVRGIATGSQGHIFAGKSIDNINEIKSVQKIVQDLCSQ